MSEFKRHAPAAVKQVRYGSFERTRVWSRGPEAQVPRRQPYRDEDVAPWAPPGSGELVNSMK
jgi:hypothetical protein